MGDDSVMETASETNYWLIWFYYLLAAAVFYAVVHYNTRRPKPSWWRYTFRALTLSFMLTPWYANQLDEVLAPALMVATLDLITVGVDAFVRGLIPLLVSLVAALIVATLVFVWKRASFSRKES